VDQEVDKSLSVKFDVAGKAEKKINVDEWTRIDLAGLKVPARATHGRILLTIWGEGRRLGVKSLLPPDLWAPKQDAGGKAHKPFCP
jgi:hypothetical protein